MMKSLHYTMYNPLMHASLDQTAHVTRMLNMTSDPVVNSGTLIPLTAGFSD